MRILYVINVMGRGGAEIQLRDRAAALVRRGHAVAIVSMMPFLDFETWLRDAGVEVFTLGLTGRSTAVMALRRYARILRKFSPEIVHSHLYVASVFARMVRLLPRAVRGEWRVLVCSSHAQKERTPSRYVVYRLTSSLGDAWTFASREGIAVHEAHGAVPRGVARWAPNGVDLAEYCPRASVRAEVRAELGLGDGFVWLALGSFRDETKDYATMFAGLARASRSSAVLIGGEGKLLEEKRALAASLGLGQRVRFLGLRSDVVRLLQAADGYLLSSQSEAMPNVLLQAAACGLPIVTTDVGEASAIVEDGRGGFVVPPRDPERFGDAVRRVELLDEVERTRMGAAGRDHVAEQFEFGRVVDRWESLYRELLSTKR